MTISGLDGSVAESSQVRAPASARPVDACSEETARVSLRSISQARAPPASPTLALDRIAARIEVEHGLECPRQRRRHLTPNLPLDELPVDYCRRNYEVVLIGTVNTCQAFGALLRARRQAVVNVASQAALVSLPQQAAYTAAKGAVAALTRSLAIDWAASGVRVNAVAPGFTLTHDDRGVLREQTFTVLRPGRIPLGASSTPDEIAAAIVFSPVHSRARSQASCSRSTGAGLAGEPALW